VGQSHHTPRFSFEGLSLADEERLVRVIFGRADSWMNWREVRAEDHPVLSFLYIVSIALQGIAAIPVALVHQLRKASSAPAPAGEPAFRSPALRSILLFSFALLGTLAGTRNITAETLQRPTFEESYDLKALGRKEPIVLKGTEARTNLYFGVPVTSVVTQASLIVSYRAAVALAPRVSTLDVHLNESVVASIPIVQSAEPESLMSTEVSIPADLLISDNALILELKGRCAPGCEGGSSQDLWLRVESTTHIRLSGTRLELKNNLGLLPAPFFDGTSHRVVTTNIAFLGPRDTHILEASGVIASWLGTLADDRGIRFAVTLDVIPAGNVIVFLRNESPIHSALKIPAVPDLTRQYATTHPIDMERFW
jgi:cellulose synthase (UDP-forming)